MHEDPQSQLGNFMHVSDLMDVEVIRCDTCGAAGFDKDLVVCHKCHEGAEHAYCMHPDEKSELEAKPELRKDWTCQGCMLREGTDKLVQDKVEVAARKRKGHLFESSTNSESSKGSKSKPGSSCIGKSGGNGVELSAKRPLVPARKFNLKSVGKMFFSGPETSAVESCGKLDHRLLASNHNTPEDPNFPNGNKRNENQQGEQPKKAGRCRSINFSELWTDPDFDVMAYMRSFQASGKPLFSGPNADESCGQLDDRLLASNDNTHQDPIFPNGKKNVSQQGEQPTKAGTSMSMYELGTDPDFEERDYSRNLVQIEAAYRSNHVVVPKDNSKWLGKFQIHNSEGIVKTWDGIQAHLSNCASVEVVEAANRLSEIVILEELPRSNTWPSQFMRNQVTEDNIALYFFAHDNAGYTYYQQSVKYMMENDLALKGNLDGVELLIFPSNILPEKSQCWNDMFFVWGVFREQKGNNSSSTPVSSSLKLKNGDTAKKFPFDEIQESEYSEYTILLVGENSNSKGGEANADVNVSVLPESETQENGFVRIEDNNNVEAPSTSHSLVPPSTFPDKNGLEVVLDALLLLATKQF